MSLTSLQRTLAPVAALWRRSAPEVRMLLVLGGVLVVSGFFHGALWLLEGAPSLSGPASWRKPIVFGLSAGVTSLSLAWVVSLLPASSGRRWWTHAYTVTMALEIFLIDLQKWRGVGSHFNTATPLDGAIFSAMGVLILVSAAAMVAFLVQTWRARTIAVDDRAAALGGLWLVQLTVVVGLAMVAHGSMVAAAHDGIPAVVGGRGLLKVPHGIALHGLQVLPLLLLALRQGGVARAERAVLVHRATVGLALVAFGALVGALAGRAPLDPSLAAAVLAIAGVGVLLKVAARVAVVLLSPGRPIPEAT